MEDKFLSSLFSPPKKEEPSKKDIVQKVEENIGATYHLAYDSFNEGLEGIYFWILDFLRGREPMSGLGYTVDKTREDFEAAVGSAFHSDIGIKATRMQEQAMKMIGTINTVLRSIINLIYDLKEFDVRLAVYNDIHAKEKARMEAAELALKQIWLDQVDIKRGRGAVHAMSQQLEFVTLRDAFLAASSIKHIDKLDLNDRVRRILKPRMEEYYHWKKESERELRKRYNIEKAYLRSQVAALKLYAQWTKPYLLAAKKLSMHDFNSPNIVSVFNNMEMQLDIFAKKEFNFQAMIDKGEIAKGLRPSQKYHACIKVEIHFRSIPHSAGQSQTGTRYSQGGRADVLFKSFALSEKDLKLYEQKELEDDLALIENLLDVSLKEIEEDVKHYLNDEEEEGPPQKRNFLRKLLKKTKDEATKREIKEHLKELEGKEGGVEESSVNPFEALYEGFKEIGKPLKGVGKNLNIFGKGKGSGFIDKTVLKAAQGQAKAECFVAYDIYKKAHRMLST
ncbi:hypothetical protein J4430_00570 [Candidatus Woesearchaeota archaeon]|nr:hypothetical protein [Candidatus Woesearchaeota archaeon]